MNKDIKDNPLYKIIAKQDVETRLETMVELTNKTLYFISQNLTVDGHVNANSILKFMNSEIESFKQSNSKYLNNK